MIDLIFDTDLIIDGGDFAVAGSAEQHQKHILIANKGECKEFPELGVGIMNMLNNEDAIAFLIEAKRNVEYDRMKVNELRFTNDNSLIVEAIYE